jgi:hypothetical protein
MGAFISGPPSPRQLQQMQHRPPRRKRRAWARWEWRCNFAQAREAGSYQAYWLACAWRGR